MTIDQELSLRLAVALQAAREASGLILEYYQTDDIGLESKSDATPVTAADRGAEKLLRERLNAAFPEDGVLGEEFDDYPAKNGYRWILDPIDGTKSFVAGVPLFGTLMGLEHEGEAVLGVCRFPGLDEVMYAVKCQGAWWQKGAGRPKRARVSTVSELGQAIYCLTGMEGYQKTDRMDVFEAFRTQARLCRGWGDCYGHMLVATGRAEVITDPLMSPWDAAALVPILQEAGGVFLSWDGQPTAHGGSGFSCNAALKDQVLEIVRPKST